MDPGTQFIVPTIIDVPELIVTNDDIDFEDNNSLGNSRLLNKLQFLSTALSYIFNLGNIWRFPYLCHKYGGGAFLVAYTFTFIFVGIPLFLMEIAFGQYANEGPITIWRISPLFEGIGHSMCLVSIIVAIYYNIINSWLIHYLLASLSFHGLTWLECDNSWNTNKCFLKTDQPMIITKQGCNYTQSMLNTTTEISVEAQNSTGSDLELPPPNSTLVPMDCSEYEKIIRSSEDVVLPTNEYFHRNVISLSESLTELGTFNWDLAVGLALVWLVVFVAIYKDFRSNNRFALVTICIPYFMLISLLFRALTLPGSTVGISYYFSINWNLLQDIDIWSDALSQIFFALSPCWGGIITLASVNKFHNNFHSDTMLIMIINYVTSLTAGLLIFSTLGYMSDYSGIKINQILDPGLGLMFIVLSEVFAKLPFATANSMIIFAILLCIGFNSQISVMETVITTVVDTWPHKLRYRKPLILMILCAVMFTLSLFICFGNGIYVLQLVDSIVGTYTTMIVGLLELLAIAWVYGMDNFMQDIDDMISVHRNLFPSKTYWYCLWKYLTPSFIFAVLLFCFIDLGPQKYQNYQHPEWTIKSEWLVCAICLLPIPTMAIFRFLLAPRGSFSERLSYLCRPSEDWAPSSYVSGPKLINRRLLDDQDYDSLRTIYSSQQDAANDQDQDSNDSNEDLRVVNGRANYIIPEEEDDTDTGFVSFITNETNV